MQDIPNYEGLYAVTEDGRVFSYRANKFLKPMKNKGYRKVTLSRDSIAKSFLIHRLVAKTWIEEVDGKPFVNHLNGIKHDNRRENLEWCTQLENVAHAVTLSLTWGVRGEDHPRAKLSNADVVQIRKDYVYGNSRELATRYGVSQRTINAVASGRSYRI